MNDRALRKIVVGMGGTADESYVRGDGYDIVVASGSDGHPVHGALAQGLKARLGRIVIGYTRVTWQSLRPAT